jgi:transcriptional regulator with PAS, ATPase and Fis domain
MLMLDRMKTGRFKVFKHLLGLKNDRSTGCSCLLTKIAKTYSAFVWLRRRSNAQIELRHVTLTDPTNFNEIYAEALAALDNLQAELDEVPNLTFHLSPGTPAMATVWIILSATKFRAELIQSSIAHGVQPVNFPFDLSAELLRSADARLTELSSGLVPETYGDIVFRSPAMARLVRKAEKAAQRSVPILIEGEPGTGQALLAHAIHKSGPRNDAHL